jgi:hypothetical protein
MSEKMSCGLVNAVVAAKQLFVRIVCSGAIQKVAVALKRTLLNGQLKAGKIYTD